MKKMKLTALAAAASIGFSAVAQAGFVQPFPVDVDLTNNIASGDQVSARGDKDNDVFIGCGSRTISTGGGTFRTGFCQAEDAAGERVICMTQDPDLLDEMRANSSYSFITFSFQPDGAGGFTCTRVGFSTQSFYLEKVKPN
ncbi:MAG: hypothetical protein GC152_12410 [Alphaproteobacteria bacterium]|nr:hypothetical protein [Alphaproteobacteria bacterium]